MWFHVCDMSRAGTSSFDGLLVGPKGQPPQGVSHQLDVCVFRCSIPPFQHMLGGFTHRASHWTASYNSGKSMSVTRLDEPMGYYAAMKRGPLGLLV